MSELLDRSQLKTRDTHIRRAHELLERYGVQWTPSRVATLVKKFLGGPNRRQSLDDYVAKAISRQLNKTSSNPKCITYADPTGDEAAYWVDHPEIERHDDMARYGTIKDTAERYGISQTTVRRYIADGRITAHRVGPRLIRVDLDQVQRELFGDKGTAA